MLKLWLYAQHILHGNILPNSKLITYNNLPYYGINNSATRLARYSDIPSTSGFIGVRNLGTVTGTTQILSSQLPVSTMVQYPFGYAKITCSVNLISTRLTDTTSNNRYEVTFYVYSPDSAFVSFRYYYKGSGDPSINDVVTIGSNVPLYITSYVMWYTSFLSRYTNDNHSAIFFQISQNAFSNYMCYMYPMTRWDDYAPSIFTQKSAGLDNVTTNISMAIYAFSV